MLKAPLLYRRTVSQICVTLSCPQLRDKSHHSHEANVDRSRLKRAQKKERKRQDGDPPGVQRVKRIADLKEQEKPSLIEQLFPEETKRYEAERAKPEREIPRLPLDTSTAIQPVKQQDDRPQSDYERQLQQQLREAGTQTSVLVLRNASKNLTEEDFRRLIPQGKHMEGWTLERGDIVKVIPGRNLATLEQQNYYYLLFSSALSAFAYQGHVTRIHRTAASHSPTSLTGPLPPPPGWMVDGLDAHDAINAYTLTSPAQNLSIRQLKPPLSPLLASIVQHQGWATLVNRPDKQPYELRLTLEGPQLQLSKIRHILYESGRDRALSWSGSESSNVPTITRWDPSAFLSQSSELPKDTTKESIARVDRRSEDEQLRRDVAKLQARYGGSEGAEGNGGTKGTKRRLPGGVYILGFQTESAAQSFRAFWHGRAMEWKKIEGRSQAQGTNGLDESGNDAQAEEAPPTARVEVLW